MILLYYIVNVVNKLLFYYKYYYFNFMYIKFIENYLLKKKYCMFLMVVRKKFGFNSGNFLLILSK